MLPKKISATNVEMLIRSPYGFKCKNLLKLKRLDNIYDNKFLSNFGNFMHKIIENYTLAYDQNSSDKYKDILQIGKNLAKENSMEQMGFFWPRFEAISRDFIDFDEKRRESTKGIYPEIYGEMKIPLKNNSVTISAIADRIDITNNGQIHILDYKTGALPTKAEVLSGISVQMIIEALIASEAGFKGIIGQVEELIYVKISSSIPYISTSIIPITKEDLTEHKKGLVKILSYYNEHSDYRINYNSKYAPSYNDYAHLSRLNNN